MNLKLPQDSNVLFFKCHYSHRKMLSEIRKQSLHWPPRQFFGSVFAKTVLVMHSHPWQIWFIQFGSRGNHWRTWQLSKASLWFRGSQNHMKESICITDLQLVIWEVWNFDLCFLHLMQLMEGLIKRGLLGNHTLDYSSKQNYKMDFVIINKYYDLYSYGFLFKSLFTFY